MTDNDEAFAPVDTRNTQPITFARDYSRVSFDGKPGRFSILYAKAKPVKTDPPDPSEYNFEYILSDLNIREVCSYTNMNEADVDFVCGIMTDFKSTRDDIALRSSVIEDFISHPGFIDTLEAETENFMRLREKLTDAKRNLMRSTGDVQGGTGFLNYSKVTHACFFFDLTYKAVFRLYREFKAIELKSPRLTELTKFLTELFDEDGVYKKLCEECMIFNEHVNDGVVFDIDMKLSPILRIIALRLYDFRYEKPKSEGGFRSFLNAFGLEDKRSRDRNIYTEKRFTHNSGISPEDDTYLKGTLEYQINLLARRLSAAYEHLIDLFLDLAGEMRFYRFALNLIDYMRRQHVPNCFAKITDTEKQSARFTDLTDLTLAKYDDSGKNSVTVVRNNFGMEETTSVSLITGGNQSGKTTFLRAFGSALILARAGLPVPARDAEVSLFGKLYTHFQRFDDELHNEGQLDTELAEMEKIVYTAKSDSVILMNESFSSTGLKDATGIAVDILSALENMGVKVIFVTHIPGLREKILADGFIKGGERAIIHYVTGSDASGAPTYKIGKA
ncbi:hypothetical protein FACS1894105_07260 [Clostridia bacterium]|nr:hypothetical protein FACS1894105_07260 [Clostridia bacterium]